jgi:hypothetical protein
MQVPRLRLSDDYRESQSWERSDPITGERFYVTPTSDRETYRVRLGDGEVHELTAYRDRGRWHARCDCPSRRDDCAHVMAFVRQYPQLCVSAVDVAHGPGGEGR